MEREELGLQKKQSFLDLGCGNGLLVYILNKEGTSALSLVSFFPFLFVLSLLRTCVSHMHVATAGYPGRGIDLMARKIWDRFGPEIRPNLIAMEM
jgi:hypothetical protein